MASPVHSPLQIAPQIFNRIQVWALAGPFQNFNLLLVKPFLCWFGCMLWVIVHWKTKFLFMFSFLAEAWRFCANIDWYLELFIIPSSLTKAPVPAEETLPQSIMLPPPCFSVGMVFFWWCAGWFLRQTYLLELWPKSSTLVSSDHNTFSHMLLGDFRCVFAKCSLAWMFFFVRKGFRLATLPHSPDIWRIREIVVTCTTQPVLARYSCSSFNVAVGLLVASQTSFLLINFGGTSSSWWCHCCATFSPLDDDCLHCVPWYI